MNIQKISNQIKKLAKDFGLDYRVGHYSYLVVSKEDIVLRNFLGGCPEPDYDKYGGKKEENRLKNILKFVSSKDFQRHKKKPQGCVINRKELRQELRLAKRIPDKELRNKLVSFYNKLLKNMKDKELILVSKPSNKQERKIFSGILSHELTHQLLSGNRIFFQKIKDSYWKWDEGLCVYLDHFTVSRHEEFYKKPRKTKNKLWNVYGEYAHKWANMLKNAQTPKERRKVIFDKYKSLKAR